MSGVRVEGLVKRYGTVAALDGVTLEFPQGEVFTLLGPSGSGKTTLLRAVAGFVVPDWGRVLFDGRPVEGVPVEARGIGMVFQSYALFPNMSVADNVAFGLDARGIRGTERARRVADALDLVRLSDLGHRRPHELSGGQRQRVAMARAIAPGPEVLLLDEPLSALDRSLRREMQVELRRIQRATGLTTILVTHDQEEALMLSDRLGILRDGRLVREGTPREVWDDPRDAFAARFLGEANLLPAAPEGGAARLADGRLVPAPPGVPGAFLAVRPEHLRVAAAEPDAPARLPATLLSRAFGGATATCILRWQGQELRAEAPLDAADALPEGGEVWAAWDAPRARWVS